MHQFTLTPTPFLGRSQEVAEIGTLLDDPSCRLLTLVGPGGIGKTWLAVEVASRKRASFPDGVFFVSLAALSLVDELLPAIAEATPFRFQQDQRSPREQFLAYLREKHANVCFWCWIISSISWTGWISFLRFWLPRPA